MPIQHPLGVGADPTKNHRTRANRDALGFCLSLYYSQDLTETIHQRSDGSSPVGLPLARRFVSLLEIGNALQRLGDERPDLLIPLELVYRYGWTREQAAARLHIDPKTLRTRIEEGLNRLLDIIWKDI